MARYDLSETEWRMISPLLPNKPRGKAGVWLRIFETLAAQSPQSLQLIDSSIVRAHQHAAGARKKGAALIRSRPSLWPENASDAPAGD